MDVIATTISIMINPINNVGNVHNPTVDNVVLPNVFSVRMGII